MPGRALIIRKPEREAIAAVISNASDNTVSMETLVNWKVSIPPDRSKFRLRDQKPGFKRPPAQEIMLEVGFRIRFSFENWPIGLCRHLYVSIDGDGDMALPAYDVVSVIMYEFGIKLDRVIGLWEEEIETGLWARSVLALDDERLRTN
jgi:hypothetical protein